VDRFVQRVWKMFSSPSATSDDPAILTKLHATIKRVTESMNILHFNTAISALMEFLNTVESAGAVSKDTAKIFTHLLAPLSPHLAEELWETLKGKGLIIDQSWPTFDPALLKTDTMTIVVQVNGKLRANIEVASDAKQADIIAMAKENENVQKFLAGQKPKKEIYVKNKLVSLVV
jgi:leucyl-tRNA synthetase